jgi:hypothetical protein
MGFGCGLFSRIRDIFRKKRKSPKPSKLEPGEPEPIVRVGPPTRVTLPGEVGAPKRVPLPRGVAHPRRKGVPPSQGDIHILTLAEYEVDLPTRTLTTREETLLTFPVEEFVEIMEEFLDI